MDASFISFFETMTAMVSSIITWISNNFTTLLFVLVVLTITIALTRMTNSLFSRLLSRVVREDLFPSKTDRDRRVRTLNSITTAVFNFIIWAVAILTILNNLGINTAPLLASAGIIGVALGFGAQSLVRDFMTGIFIIAENQYRVGDYVEIQNIKGTVRAVTMRTTVIKDDNGSVFHIPNGSIVVTGNHTMGNNTINLELSFGTDTDIEKAQAIINKVGITQAKSESMQDLITEPVRFLRVKTIASGSIQVRVLGKVRSGKQADVQSDFLMRLQKELQKSNITLK